MSTGQVKIKNVSSCLTVGEGDALSWTACDSSKSQIFDIRVAPGYAVGTGGKVDFTYGDKYLTVNDDTGKKLVLSTVTPPSPVWRHLKSTVHAGCGGSPVIYEMKYAKNEQYCLSTQGTKLFQCDCTMQLDPGTAHPHNIVFEDIVTSPAGSATSPSGCDCEEEVAEAKKEVEDNFPFIGKKGGPLAWGWWIIIGLGVTCVIGIVATYFLAARK